MGRYEPLTRFLEACRDGETRMMFREIENILERPLPSSARRHQPWWANTTSHSQADSWMRVGWRTGQVDLSREQVVFRRDDPPPTLPHSPTPAARPAQAIIEVDPGCLTGGAIRLLEDLSEEKCCSFAEAVVDILNATALERRRQLLDRFPFVAGPSSVDSVDLIREDRDAR